MNPRERILAAVKRQPVDRVPYAFWRHFPAVDHSPAGLAQAALRFHDRYGSDFLKLSPRAGWAVQAWGSVEGDEVLPAGNRRVVRYAVQAADDWRRIRPLEPASADGYAQHVETIVRVGFDRRIADVPVLPTLFSPLSLAQKLAGARLADDLRHCPDLVISALEAITETVIRFAELALDEGVSGVFYSIQTASQSVIAEEEYARFGEPYDRRVLDSIGSRSNLTLVHAHGDRLMFDRIARLPAHAWNWADRSSTPSLAAGTVAVPGAVIGGLDEWKTLRDGTPEQAVAEAVDAIAQTGGVGLIIGPGCVLAMNTPDATLAAVVRALGGPLRPIPGVVR